MQVSQPEVNTRERLVAERARESEWITKQLERTEEAAQGFQALHDMRTFTGTFAELRAGFDPDKGNVNEGRQAALEAEANANALDARVAELAARQRFELAQADYAAGKPVTATTPATTDLAAIPLPENPAPFGRSAGAAPSLPSPASLVPTQAKRSALDAFHDKLAYRDAVIAALRESQLDDSHDAFGHTLYEFGFDLTLVPGDDSTQFVQVAVDVVPTAPSEEEVERDKTGAEQKRLEDRQGEVLRLFDNWVRDVGDHMVLDYEDLRQRVRSEWPPHADRPADSPTVRWLIYECLPIVEARIQDDVTKIVSRYAHREEYGQQLRSVQARLSQDCVSVREVIENEQRVDPSTVGRDADPLLLLDTAAAYAIWGAYRWELQKIITVNPPAIETKDGQVVARFSVVPAPAVRRSGRLGFSWAETTGLEHLGSCRFVDRLMQAEATITAIDVQPKEYVQSISDVSARESLLNLMLSLRAVLGSVGADAQFNSQFLRREQEIVHALTRAPLLIGFGKGAAHFGWIAGPKAAIVDGELTFLHSPVRHDFCAAISAPAWLTRIQLRGRYDWVDDDGDLDEGQPLWEDRLLTVRLPMPEDASRSITAALVGHSSSVLASVYRDTARPRPRVRHPVRGDAAANVLVAGAPRQQLLIRGDHLWREPQVFVGNQRANRVEVLSDMNGLLAHFDELQFPGDPPERGRDGRALPLVVVTAYGSHHVADAVTVLPPRPTTAASATPAPKGSGDLLTPFVSPDQKSLRFALARPKAYAGLRVALRPVGDPEWERPTIPERWNSTDDEVSFELPAATRPTAVYEVLVELQARASEWMPLRKDAQRFARFRVEADRAVSLLDGSSLEFDSCGRLKSDDRIVCSAPRTFDEALVVAYPGLQEALIGQTLRLQLSARLGSEVVALPARAEKGTDAWFFFVEAEKIRAQGNALAGPVAGSRDWLSSLAFGDASRTVRIPVLAAGGSATADARITAKRDALVAPKASLETPRLLFTESDGSRSLVTGSQIDIALPRTRDCELQLAYPWLFQAPELVTPLRLIVGTGLGAVKLEASYSRATDHHIVRVAWPALDAKKTEVLNLAAGSTSVQLPLTVEYAPPGRPSSIVDVATSLTIQKKN